MSKPAILLLGGTGKVASEIAPLLKQAGYPTLLASRSGKAPDGFTGVKFDWSDPTTYANPFAETSNINAVLIVAPNADDILTPIVEFVKIAREKGAKRFVFLSTSITPIGGPVHGKVHEYLAGAGVEWAVLRPTWFMDNFAIPDMMRYDPKEGKVYDAAGHGKLPFVAARDIGAVGFRALVDEKPHNTDHIILGPEMLTYEEASKILSEGLDRPVEHVSLSTAELISKWESVGWPSELCNMLAGLEEMVAGGIENRTNNVVFEVTGQKPWTLREFVAENKGRF